MGLSLTSTFVRMSFTQTYLTGILSSDPMDSKSEFLIVWTQGFDQASRPGSTILSME